MPTGTTSSGASAIAEASASASSATARGSARSARARRWSVQERCPAAVLTSTIPRFGSALTED